MSLVLVPVLGFALLASIPEREIQSWEAAHAIEKAPAALNTRSLLLAWYTRHYQEPEANPGRLRQILWVIGNHPDMRLSDERSLNVDERDREAFRLVCEAWRKQVAGRPENVVVLIRAAHAFARSEPESAAAWLKSAITQSAPLAKKEQQWPANIQQPDFWCTWSHLLSEAKTELAHVYVDAMTGVTARTPWEARGSVDTAVAGTAFARAARQAIDQCNDAALLVQAATWLNLTIGSLQDARFVPLAWAWLQKAEHLDNTSWATAMTIDRFQRDWSSKQPGIPPASPRVQQPAGEAQPIDRIAADCPANMAEFAPAGLSVNVKLIVATDGRVRFALLQGGHPAAIPLALDAARKWRFATGYRGNEPVEVETAVTIPVCAQRP